MNTSARLRSVDTVVVTGVGGFVGGRVAARLAARPGVRVIGIDPLSAGRRPVGLDAAVEFHGSPTEAAELIDLFDGTGADTVVHTAVYSRPEQVGGRAAMKDRNILDAMQLFAACVHAPQVSRLVVRSSSAVYGYGPRNPGRFTEDMTPQHPPTRGFTHDWKEIEGYARSAVRRREGLEATVLRLAPMIGGTIDSELSRYYQARLSPSVLGFDPRIQLLHQDDAVAAFDHAAHAPAAGVFNIAGAGVLGGRQATRMAGRIPLPLPGPVLGGLGPVLRVAGRGDFSTGELGFLMHGVVLDTTRAARLLGFRARYSTRAAFTDFLRAHGMGPSRLLTGIGSAGAREGGRR